MSRGDPSFPNPTPGVEGDLARLASAQVLRDGTQVPSHIADDGRYVVVDDVNALLGGRVAYVNLVVDGTPRQFARVGWFLAGLPQALEDYARRCPPNRGSGPPYGR